MAAEDLEWERSKISNQDMNLLKRLGFTKEKDALRFPREESYPKPPMEYRVSFVDHLIRGLSPPIHEFLRGLLFVYGLQLHQLTPNSILHVSIFITLCECFLGVQPNWALWKRIVCLRRNGSHGVAYNIGGVVICVHSDVDYFDVKFPDSVQGWRKRWLYVHEESSDSMEYNIAPFDGKAKILRRRSWDAEASEEEKLATEALMTRIRELQSTRGKELGIQITAYFLRIRMQPLQARKNPLWMYAGDEDVERLSTDLSAKDLEKLIRRISKLSKKDTIPTSCKVAPFCRANPLPKGNITVLSIFFIFYRVTLFYLLFLPFPRVGKSKNGLLSPTTTRVLLALKVESGIPINPRLLLKKRLKQKFLRRRAHLFPAASPKGKRKRDEAIDSGTSKVNCRKMHSMPRKKLWIFTVLHSSARRTHQEYELENPEDDELLDALSLLEIHGTEARNGLDEAEAGLSRLFPYFFHKREQPATFIDLAQCFNGKEDLGLQLRQEGLKVGVEGTMALIAESQQQIDWSKGKIALQQAQDAISEKDSAVAEAAAATSRENFMLQLLTDASLDMAGSFLDAATEDERVEARSNVLLRLAKDHGSSFWGTPERTRQIVRFQDGALQVRDYLDFCTRTLSLVYGTMFPRNKMPETLPALMDKFRDAPRIHGFVRAQLAAGARFAMIMIKICYPKLDVGQIVPKFLAKTSKRKRNFGKYDDIVTPVADDMMDELLRMDAEFFVKGIYAEHSTRAVNNERLTIDNILGNP
ncbi:hypothetical protein QYE76_064827 [Lolium multiflorum]|uniref:Transposase (putative) gypsy type domain-containing protein n=1 Tax=Lolium multiflorum TaxID=4521 RepID=A0AAD8S9X7_LOLMU|nr:hypothetical protein QYE76_064827 [Lolium multiflorum]